MRLIPPEDAPFAEVEAAPMSLTWDDLHTGSYSGHNGEYLMRLPCITDRGRKLDIPDSVADILAADLGSEWQVDNRGSRVEISHRPIGPHNHELMMEATQRLLEQVVLPRYT